jgi:hypothetical protein
MKTVAVFFGGSPFGKFKKGGGIELAPPLIGPELS